MGQVRSVWLSRMHSRSNKDDTFVFALNFSLLNHFSLQLLFSFLIRRLWLWVNLFYYLLKWHARIQDYLLDWASSALSLVFIAPRPITSFLFTFSLPLLFLFRSTNQIRIFSFVVLKNLELVNLLLTWRIEALLQVIGYCQWVASISAKTLAKRIHSH